MNDLFYIIGKIPFNFSKNLLGISLWTDTLSLRHPELFLHSPLYTINVSYLSFIGDIKLIGIYDFNFSPVLDTFFIMLTIFSIMPIVICAILLNFNTRALWQEAPLTIKIATIYGLICFILSPCIGSSVFRLMGYSWPLFWISMPYFIKNIKIYRGGEFNKLVLIYILLLWPMHFLYLISEALSYKIFMFFLVLVMNLKAFIIIKNILNYTPTKSA